MVRVDAGRKMIGLEEARNLVLANLESRPMGTVEVDLADALDRVLAEECRCAEDLPARDLSAMDGFALRATDLPGEAPFTLPLAGESLAGHPAERALPKGACMRVMTGGVLPEGADLVVPVEHTSGFEALEGGEIRFEVLPREGDNVRVRGGLRRKGDLLLEAGSWLGPAEIGILGNQGRARVRVGRRPRVAVLPTGDEIIPVGEVPGPGQVRNSNAWTIAAQARRAGAEVEILPPVGDREGELVEVLSQSLATHDLVCTIGGVSAGTKDLVRPAFEACGGKERIEAIRIKPGKPTVFGGYRAKGHRAAFFGLPGNPASTLTIFALLVRPWILAFQGIGAERLLRPRQAALWFSKVRPNRRLQALPGRLRARRDGTIVEHLRQKDSSDLFCFAKADVLILIPENEAPRDGDPVSWIPLFSVPD